MKRKWRYTNGVKRRILITDNIFVHFKMLLNSFTICSSTVLENFLLLIIKKTKKSSKVIGLEYIIIDEKRSTTMDISKGKKYKSKRFIGLPNMKEMQEKSIMIFNAIIYIYLDRIEFINFSTSTFSCIDIIIRHVKYNVKINRLYIRTV
jgi:hypothetical protein